MQQGTDPILIDKESILKTFDTSNKLRLNVNVCKKAVDENGRKVCIKESLKDLRDHCEQNGLVFNQLE
jgi:hypothetical protein